MERIKNVNYHIFDRAFPISMADSALVNFLLPSESESDPLNNNNQLGLHQ